VANKYHAKRTALDGINFHSKGEAKRYSELKLLEAAGVISELRTQVRFPLTAASAKIGDYVADFTYAENGVHITEDFKGPETALFRWKRKHLLAEWGIELRITKARK
jgi:hypothetical protein